MNKPIIYDMSKSKDQNAFTELCTTHPNIKKIDCINNQLVELFEVQNPELIKYPEKKQPAKAETCWVYFPWSETVVHILNKTDYELVRISRNTFLIPEKEQNVFRQSVIAIAGLNVGNPGAICIVQEGGSMRMKLADFDTVSLSNLNRFRAGLAQLGENKCLLTAKQAYEINPYIELELYEKGIDQNNIDDFLLKPKIDLLIEEVDNLPLKIELRERAKKHNIPVLMVTGNGSNIIVDIERYDLDSNIELLNGHLKDDVKKKIITGNVQQFSQKIELMRDFMGSEFLTQELQNSFLQVGNSIPGIPQLAEATFLRGAALAYFARKIVTKDSVPSGRYTLELDTVTE